MAQVDRPILEFKNTSLRYKLTTDDQLGAFSRQYYQMYKVRLAELKKRVLQAAKNAGNYSILLLLFALKVTISISQ